MTKIPERKHVVGIKISADTWDDVKAALGEIERQLYESGPGMGTVSGGSSFSYMLFDQANPEMTHDKYFDALDQWLKETKEEKVPA